MYIDDELLRETKIEAERYGATRLATLDMRHLTVVRPRHVAAFTLVHGSNVHGSGAS